MDAQGLGQRGGQAGDQVELALVEAALAGLPEQADRAPQQAAAAQHGPQLVVQAQGVDERPVAGTADVLAAIRFAAAHDLPVAVQATGHGAAGPADDALLVNTRRMTGVWLDPAARTARIQAGVRREQVIHEAAPFGLAPLNGSSPLVGAVGYTLGGGLGPLGRAYGYAADHVRSIDLVPADGRLRHVTPTQHDDLFWGLRGGKGNFGVVTALEVELVPVARLYGGGLYFPGELAAAALVLRLRELGWVVGQVTTATTPALTPFVQQKTARLVTYRRERAARLLRRKHPLLQGVLVPLAHHVLLRRTTGRTVHFELRPDDELRRTPAR